VTPAARALLRVVAVALAIAGCGRAPDPPPNIVLVIGDDHGYPDAGFMGSSIAETPNLDRLADEGTVFRVGYSTASLCRPALRSFLTGLHPIQFDRRRQHLERAGAGRAPLRERFHTLPALLAERGYASFQSGKHPEGAYTDTGFTHGMTTAAGRKGRLQGIQIGRETMQPLFEFIDAHREQPFFVWYAPQLPHLPHDPPEAYLARYKDRGLPWFSPGYYGSVTWLDATVGALVAHLEQAGVRERTLLVYVSDNGWQPPGPGVDYDYLLGGARGKKSLYELGFRTPILFHWPERIAPGSQRDELVSIVDLFPTLLGFAGAAVPENRPGRDLRPLLADPSPDRAPRRELVGTAAALRTDRDGATPGGAFLRSDRWHYLSYNDGREALFDVVADPEETRDIVAENPDVARAARARILEWVAGQLEPVEAAGASLGKF